MKIQRLIFLAMAVAVVLLAGCEAWFEEDTVGLYEPKLAKSVDPNTRKPVEILEEVTTETGTVFATVKHKKAPSGTKVRITFYRLEDGKRLIVTDEIIVEGDSWVSLEAPPPADGWPQGVYEVEFLLNGAAAEKIVFKVKSR